MAEFDALGARLKELRSELGLNQTKFAKELDISPATLSAYETGVKNPSLGVLKTIAEKYKVSLDWLCGLDDSRNVDKALSTYSDVIQLLIQIKDSGVGVKLDVKTAPTPSSALYLTGIIMLEFSKEWRKILSVYESNLIDREVYDLWVEKALRKYDLEIGDYSKAFDEGDGYSYDRLIKHDWDGSILDEIPWEFVKDES